ncbi:unnamed protein product, partial [Rotaria sordida]
VKKRYAGIPQQAVIIFINMCDVCQVRRSFHKQPAGKPIVSLGFLTRLQVDLMDMRSTVYDGFCFIMHCKDHFTKFSWLFPLKSKEASGVAFHLKNIFYTFGPPRILQSDNGKEFVANVILNLKNDWPELLIINGRARHPQSQGLVERANAVVQQMLGKWLDVNKTSDWPSGLGPVMLSINNCTSQSTKKTPYEMVFGQPCRIDHEFWLELHKESSTNDSIVNEEDLPGSFLQKLNTVTTSVSTNINDQSQISDETSTCISSIDSHMILPVKELTETSHKRIRDEAEKNYIHTVERQLKIYERALKKQKSFEINDIIGLKIADVDRSNTAPSILPCKIIEIIKKDDPFNVFYKLATQDGIISELFSSSEFMDLTQTVSSDLRKTDITQLANITFIQACQIFTKFKTNRPCKCIGSCESNRCPCKKRLIKCCTKCHRGKAISCKNNI